MSYTATGVNWRFIIVEDNEDTARQLVEILPTCVDSPDTVSTFVFEVFSEAAEALTHSRYDLLILDLKDDNDANFDSESEPAGLSIFQNLKKSRFVPVIFYTALAHSVRPEQTSFVRVVEKTEDVTKVRDEARNILATNLPGLTRHIEALQRDYMWDFISTHWKDYSLPHEQADLAYLLARRLALSLEAEARRLARKLAGKTIPLADVANIHPMEMYVPPPVGSVRSAGDIVRANIDGQLGHWIVLTPSCDFEQKDRLFNVLLAHCVPLEKESEFLEWKGDGSTEKAAFLKALIGDNREHSQAERYKFLPGTYFFPDSVVDFQRLRTVRVADFQQMQVVASLDSPFAEAVLARFSRYFGRLGTRDIDKQVVLKRLEAINAAGCSGEPPATE